MTPQDKINWLALKINAEWDEKDISHIKTAEDIAQAVEESECLLDAYSEIREGQFETDIPCEWSRHYESKSVAHEMPDGSWVGWTYWYGGGKWGEPDAIDWQSEAYDLDCVEKEQTVIVHEFSKRGE